MSATDLRLRVISMARSRPSPTRAQLRAQAMKWLALSIGASALLFLVAGGPSLAPRPSALLVATTLGEAWLAGLALWVALGRGRSMLGRAPSVYWATTALTPYALLAWRWRVTAQFPEREVMMADTVRWHSGFAPTCVALTMSLAAPPLFALLAGRRDSEAADPGPVGAALGVAVGAAAWVAMDLYCSVAFPAHLVLGHVLPTLLLGALGHAAGRALLTLRE